MKLFKCSQKNMNKFLRISFFEREQNYCEILKNIKFLSKTKF